MFALCFYFIQFLWRFELGNREKRANYCWIARRARLQNISKRLHTAQKFFRTITSRFEQLEASFLCKSRRSSIVFTRVQNCYRNRTGKWKYWGYFPVSKNIFGRTARFECSTETIYDGIFVSVLLAVPAATTVFEQHTGEASVRDAPSVSELTIFHCVLDDDDGWNGFHNNDRCANTSAPVDASNRINFGWRERREAEEVAESREPADEENVSIIARFVSCDWWWAFLAAWTVFIDCLPNSNKVHERRCCLEHQ